MCKKLGWYSAKAAEKMGTSIYTTPKNIRVAVTAVSESPDHGTLWDDMVCVGEVVQFVDHKPGSWSFTDNEVIDCDDEQLEECGDI